MNSTFSIFLDLLVSGLMIATIAYAVSLNRSISKLRDGKAELAVLLANLAESVTHADVAIKGMKSIATEYDTGLAQRIGTARALIDELGVINETANNLASRLEKAARSGRLPTPAAPLSAPARGGEPVALVSFDDKPSADAKSRKAAGKGRSGEEQELIDAIAMLRRSA